MTEPFTVQQLIPAYCNPSKDPASAGRVRQAFVAHTFFFHEAGSVAVQLDQLVRAQVDDHALLVKLLCESYSRAVFETLFAMHFDQQDPRADALLLDQIRDVYGPDLAGQVHEVVKTRGVTLAR